MGLTPLNLEDLFDDGAIDHRRNWTNARPSRRVLWESPQP